MRIGSRLFPYPTLNNNSSLSEYDETADFGIVFDCGENGELLKNESGYILKNVCFKLKNEQLLKLYKEDSVKCSLIVESPASNYRANHELTLDPQEIVLNTVDLKGAVTVSAYLWAAKDIGNYVNESFSDEYAEYKFDIERYDILAIDDGFKFQVEFDPLEDNKMPSIFTIVPKDSNEKQIEYQNLPNNIVITLPARYYKQYDMIKGKEDWQNVMFGIMAIPALAGCISEIKKDFGDEAEIDDIIGKYKWFRAVYNRYEKVTGKKLDDELMETDSLTLAQLVLNNATCNGIDYVADFLLHGIDREEVDDE